MAEHDDFYDQLPFTLEDNQTTPEYVIFGTGLQETLIAAYKSKMELKPGLIIDTQKTYGSALKTLTFKEFHQLSSLHGKEKMYEFVTPNGYQESNSVFFEECLAGKKHRGYSIDIEPSLFLGSSVTCECLKQADMDKYMDFHLVKSILYVSKNQFKHVPLSKGKIFDAQDLSLPEKKHLLNSLHKLMKIYQKYMNVELDMNSTKQFDKDGISVDQNLYKEFLDNLNNFFLPFIEKMVKNNKKIVDFLTYIICNYQYNYGLPIPQHAKQSYTLKGFITKFGKFIKSCGIYGEIPYLYVDNGIGDIPQAYSRIASIFASVYILHPKVQITQISKPTPDTFEIKTNLSPNKPITTKELFFGPTQLELRKVAEEFYEEKILRVFLLAQKSGKEEACPAICFINELKEFVNPVYMFLFDNSSHSCPGNYIFYQFQTIIEKEGAEECQKKGEKLIEVLEGIYGEEFRKSIRYYSVYIRTRRYPKQSSANSKEAGVGLNDTMGVDLDQHFQNFIGVVGEHESYFKKDNGQKQEDQFYGDDAKYILEKMDELNINAKPEEEEAKEEKRPKKLKRKQERAPKVEENKVEEAKEEVKCEGQVEEKKQEKQDNTQILNGETKTEKKEAEPTPEPEVQSKEAKQQQSQKQPKEQIPSEPVQPPCQKAEQPPQPPKVDPTTE